RPACARVVPRLHAPPGVGVITRPSAAARSRAVAGRAAIWPRRAATTATAGVGAVAWPPVAARHRTRPRPAITRPPRARAGGVSRPAWVRGVSRPHAPPGIGVITRHPTPGVGVITPPPVATWNGAVARPATIWPRFTGPAPTTARIHIPRRPVTAGNRAVA